MNTLMSFNYRDNFFERTIDEILNDGFFNSLDSNIIDKGNQYVLEVDVPGMTKQDLNLSITNNTLLIHGQKVEKLIGNVKIKSKEFSSTKFQRSYRLPSDINENGISAKCKHGLLKIYITKKRDNIYHRTIQIETEEVPKSINNIFRRLKNFFKNISR